MAIGVLFYSVDNVVKELCVADLKTQLYADSRGWVKVRVDSNTLYTKYKLFPVILVLTTVMILFLATAANKE